jgi:hypothetical protein
MEMIVERLSADGASHPPFPVLPEEDNHVSA